MLTVKERRVAAGLTQEELAEAAGLGIRTIRRAEAGERIPQGASLLAIAKALGVSLDDLFVHADDATEPESAAGENGGYSD